MTVAPGRPHRLSPGERRLASFFKLLNRFMLGMWRIGDGRFLNLWPSVGGRIMVLTHTGRRSGRRRRTPVNYAEQGETVFCTAGFGPRADWYRNLQADPHVEVWLPGRRWSGLAEDVSRAPDGAERLREVLIGSGFAAYLAGLHPTRMTRAELNGLLEEYRLIRIRPRDRRETDA